MMEAMGKPWVATMEAQPLRLSSRPTLGPHKRHSSHGLIDHPLGTQEGDPTFWRPANTEVRLLLIRA